MRVRGRPLVQKVLSTIANAAIAFAHHPARTGGSLYRALREFDMLQEASDEQLRSVSRYVIAKKYITVRHSRESASITISSKGAKLIQSAAILSLRPQKQVVWDGKWRIVLFDIPNRMKHTRDAFAATLKRLEFLSLQKSVFLCPYPCAEELEAIADYYGINDCVVVIVSERFRGDRTYKAAFGI